MKNFIKDSFMLSKDIENIVERAKSIIIPESREQLIHIALGGVRKGSKLPMIYQETEELLRLM